MNVIRNLVWIASGTVVATCVTLVGGAWVQADVLSKNPTPDRIQSLRPNEKAAIESANHLSVAFRAVSNAMLPTLVAIENRPVSSADLSRRAEEMNERLQGRNPFEGTPFEEMFRGYTFREPSPGDSGANMRRMPSPMRRGIGSGVIIDADGIILTNNHVVAGGGEVIVRTYDGREFVAMDVWTDPKTDLAVVKIEDADDLVAAPLGNSDESFIGDWVLALGQPFGLQSTVTAGIISAKHRDLGITDRENFLQTDAAINPGNSGGPLVNLRGEVIGINTAIHSRSGGNNGIGFAIPSNLARWVANQLVEEGKVRRAFLGVTIQAVNNQLASELDVEPRTGVVVMQVFDDTPAADAGLKQGDVILQVAGKSVATPQALQLVVERTPLGDTVPLRVMRDGESIELSYEATELPKDLRS
ncbi:MAG: trypsin-like peptidase domain-containing protein [Planctomycetota bacterium]